MMDTDKLVERLENFLPNALSCYRHKNVEVNELDCRLDRTEMNLLASNMALRVAPTVFILQHGLTPYVLLSPQSRLHFFKQDGIVMPSNGQRNET
jgi:hypothetical protein